MPTGPILLGCELDSQSQPADNDSWRKLPRHQDEDQVQLDVNRSFIYYPRRKLCPCCIMTKPR